MVFSVVQIFAIVLLLLLGNWILTGSLVYIPLWISNHLASWGLWGSAFFVTLFLGWCLGEDFQEF